MEIQNSTLSSGKKIKRPGMMLTHPARIEKAQAIIESMEVPPGGVKIASGEDTIMVKRKGIKAKWVKYEMTMSGTKVQITTWSSDDIPGMQVKYERTHTVPVKMTESSLLFDFKADKK